MNIYLLNRPPENIEEYVKPPEHCCMDDDAVEEWLREKLNEAKFNLHVRDCFPATIENVSREASQGRYRVQRLENSGSTPAAADYFFKRMPV